MQNSPRKKFNLTLFFLSFEGIFPLQFVTCIPTRFLFLFLQFKILRIKKALNGTCLLHMHYIRSIVLKALHIFSGSL
jgi:hypothetical protein